MKTNATRLLLLAALIFSIPLEQRARSAAIIYTATDLANPTPGEDVWEYSYQISQFAFAAGQGFTIFFDRTLFTQIQSPPPVNPGWDLISLQPDLVLSSDGFYAAMGFLTPALVTPLELMET